LLAILPIKIVCSTKGTAKERGPEAYIVGEKYIKAADKKIAATRNALSIVSGLRWIAKL